MKILMSGNASDSFNDIHLTSKDQKNLKSRLLFALEFLNEEGDYDLQYSRNDSVQNLMDTYFYWGDEYNGGYLGFDESDCEDDIDRYILQEFNKYMGKN